MSTQLTRFSNLAWTVIALSPTAVALDVGGTKLAAAVVGADGTVLSRRQIPTPARESAPVLEAAVLRVVALADLDDVVIGGGVATNAHDLLFGRIREQVRRLAGPEFIRRVRIDRSTLGGDAGLLGAAALALHTTGSRCAAV